MDHTGQDASAAKAPAILEYAGARTATAEYVPELDSLRTLAILSVMCIHWLPRGHVINRLQHGTGWGVYLFFVLSGYLITRILLRCRDSIEKGTVTPKHSLRQFYARRFLRIFPLYYMLLLIGFALNVEGVRENIAWLASYLSNVASFRHGGFVGPTIPFWSLAVEEQFYLLWPLAILFVPVRKIVPFVVLMVVFGFACKFTALYFELARGNGAYLLQTPACVHCLAVGALIAACESSLCGSHDARARLLRIYLVLAAVFGVGLIAVRIVLPHSDTAQKIMIHGGATLLFGWIVAQTARGISGPIGAVLRFSPSVYLGKISYGLYCYHSFMKWTLLWFAPYLARAIGERRAEIVTTSFFVRFAVTVLVASASWQLFEKPLNDLKRYFPYSRKARPLPLEERGVPIPSA